jgi:Serine/threonine protein kinase
MIHPPDDSIRKKDLQNKEGPSSVDSFRAPADSSLTFDPADFPLERYRPIRALGTGTNGCVYLCEDKKLYKDVAVKVLRAVDGEQLMAFQQEAKSTCKLTHPNIVRVFDFGATSNGTPYMVMEFFDGTSLDKIIEADGPLEVERAAQIFSQVADALAAAHQHGVFHRDLKTSNILISNVADQIDVRLIDFGIASMKPAEESLVVQGMTIVGTPNYMSPDQCLGRNYDARSEVYSLGCVIFESLTATPPFVADTALETISKHANEAPPRLSDLRRFHGTAVEFEHIVARCLEKHPDDRYQSMSELGSDLHSILHSDLPPPTSDIIVGYIKGGANRDRTLSLVMFALIFFCAASWLAYLQIGKIFANRSVTPSIPRPAAAVQDFQTLIEQNKFAFAKDTDGKLICTGNTLVKDADLKELATQSTLKDLRLSSSADVKGPGLAHLVGLPIERLLMSHTGLDESGMFYISQMRQLQYLDVSGCPKIGSRGFEMLSATPIKRLYAARAELDDRDLASIASLHKLTLLDIANNYKITAVGLKSLESLPKLADLEVSCDSWGTAEFKALSNLKHLEKITLGADRTQNTSDLLLLKKYLTYRSSDSMAHACLFASLQG